jgi:hypothetical protein
MWSRNKLVFETWNNLLSIQFSFSGVILEFLYLSLMLGKKNQVVIVQGDYKQCQQLHKI